MIGDEGAPLPHRLRLAARRVSSRLKLELGVDLGAEQDDVEREVEPEEEHDHGAEGAVGFIVVPEVRDVEPTDASSHIDVANTEPTLTHCHLALWRHGP